MKKTLVIALFALFALSSCGGGNKGEAKTDNQDSSAQLPDVSGQLAYVNIDTLISRYDMFSDLSTVLQEKADKAEAELTSKGRSLERGMTDFQEKAEKGLATRAQLAEMQERLVREEESFYQHRDKVQQELAEENQVMMNNIYHSLNSFLSEYNKDYRYGMILSTSGGSPVLHADPAMDITEQVLKGLNEKYAKEKK